MLYTTPEFADVPQVFESEEDWQIFNEFVFMRKVLSRMIYG